MKLKSKLFAGAVAVAMVLSVAPFVASAQTTAELTAQINSLLAMIAQLQAQVASSSTTSTGSTTTTTTFTTDLTVGSTGAQVSALQQFLVSKGHLVMPAGVAYGYFGGLTRAALAAYQASVGITPAVGYFGPITRAKVNVTVTTTTTTTTTTVAGCVAGAVYSSTTGALCSSNVLPAGCTVGAAFSSTTGASCSTGVVSNSGTITTPGVEGTLSVSSNSSGLVSTVYAGDTKDAILGFNVEAKTSDIAIQRIKLDLGTQTKFYNAIYSKLYVTDGSNTLASIDLNSSTVTKEVVSGVSHYFVTLAGFNYVVPKDTKKQIVIKADLYSSIDSADFDPETYPIALASDGVRGIDGAGIDQYAGDTSITRTPTVSKALSDAADLKLSLNSSSPLAQDVVAADGSLNNELDGLTLLTFNVKAEKDALTLQDLTVHITYGNTGGGTATATTVYLYDGSTELDNASVAATSATAASASFTDLGFVIPKDTTKTLTIKVDVRTADGSVRTMTANIAAADITVVENSMGDSLASSAITGSATGNALSIRDSGVEIALVSKSITTPGAPQGSSANTLSTSTLTATFNVKIKAVGNDIYLGTVGSTTNPVFANTGASNSFQLFKNGVATADTLSGVSATTTSFTIPSTCTTDTSRANTCVLAEGSEVTIPVTFMILGRSNTAALTSGLYSVELQKVNWNAASYSDFMNGDANWKTAEVSFP